ncbi:MAG: hypothetical protein GY906_23425 [bacterium]|nr:hypothetical protein [bacterium]
MSEFSKFLIWWREDKDRKFCTLEQAAGAYMQTFPGRTIALLIELLCKSADVSDPKEPHEQQTEQQDRGLLRGPR